MTERPRPGLPYPLGATYDGRGVNFAIFSENATSVELCLFDEHGAETRHRLREVTGHVWHGYVRGLQPGQIYGYRVDGPYEPEKGHRFNRNKLLIDPYAHAIVGEADPKQPIYGYRPLDPQKDLSFSEDDDAAAVPKCVVVASSFDWGDDRKPCTPWNESIIYEVHVKGFSIRNPEVPEGIRGTYAGLGSEPSIAYLKRLGVTAVELLPVHEILDEGHLLDKGLRNYWGYNTINFFAPAARYAAAGRSGGQVDEFKAMVKSLHAAGIEVILDVVYNHTAEGNELGPTLSLKGIDNATYYRLVQDQPRYYMNYTGTGNALNTRQPQVLKLIMDSLRFWAEEMRVDGFRFDLASTLARELHEVDRLGSFFDIMHQDPVLSRMKLIAEPWDVGDGGYQVGNFPVLWAEWNDKYRDTVRKFWRGDPDQMAGLGWRLTGSGDLYQDDGRHPYSSVNFIIAHDGFTLRDLVSYERKHNEANGEENRDGTDNNLSANYGAEGETDDRGIVELRYRQMRNFLATLLLSQGTPMICGGDELGRTQGGNNNAYAQDNEISWFDWSPDEDQRALLEFTKRLIATRKAHRSLSRSKFFRGRPIRGSEIRDITWLRADGGEMTDQEWDAEWFRSIGMLLAGDALLEFDADGNRIEDDTLIVLLNAHTEAVPFTLPNAAQDQWKVVLDTFRPEIGDGGASHAGGSQYPLEARSCVLLRRAA